MRELLSIIFVLILLSLNDLAVASPGELELKVQKTAKLAIASSLVVKASQAASARLGSAFVVDRSQGLVATNYHVIAGQREVSLVALSGTTPISAVVIYYEMESDLALLKASDSDKLPASVDLGDSNALKLGQFVLAAGSPGGYEHSISLGVVSSLSRVLPRSSTAVRYIQVDAPMYRGSSGGGVFNLEGDLVGMSSRGGANGAAAFAIPSRVIKDFLKDYRQNAKRRTKEFGFLGVNFQPLTELLKQEMGIPSEVQGAVISHVFNRTGAFTAGLRPADIVTRIGRFKVSAANEHELTTLNNTISSLGVVSVKVEFLRKGQKKDLMVTLDENPPCTQHRMELSKGIFLLYSKGGCFLVPDGEFIEVKKVWDMNIGRKSERLQGGDLIVSIDGSKRGLQKKLERIFSEDRSADKITSPSVLQVLRHGTPLVVLIK